MVRGHHLQVAVDGALEVQGTDRGVELGLLCDLGGLGAPSLQKAGRLTSC
jgi:hypothetical protein